ncbi:MAG: hypothetical protein KDA79_24350, partial [Planctomycetaceae bacterium]|nr:hypothetical protein [Planctomycetaceae bacterium]
MASPVTLRASSYEESLNQWRQWRRSNLHWLASFWSVFLSCLALAVVAGLVYFYPHPLLITGVGLVLLLIVVDAITPDVHSARVASPEALERLEADMAAGAEALQEPVFEFSGVADIAETTNILAGTASLTYRTSGQVSSSIPEAKPAKPVRVRRSFPETLLWRPELITNEQGRLEIDVQLADSITTWQLSASAVSATGRLGATQQPVQVFQPFFVDLNLPVALTRNDVVTVPIVVYNYLDAPQTVELTINRDEWYVPLGDQQENVLQVELQPREVRSLEYPLKAVRVGRHMLEVTARAGEAADALRKEVTVDSDGIKVEQVASGSLDDPATLEVLVPADAIEGSVSAVLKLYPSRFSELLEGMEGIFRRPSGCFEQTSSTTYPNVLALDYLKRTGQQLPEIEANARQYIHLGWQKLISFEVAGGGFDWFGNPPANVTLTAYGLMEFQDMARVYDVDPEVLARTREWLLSRRRPDGHWPADRGMLNDGLAGAVQRGDNLDLVSTAYVAWAVFGDQKQRNNDPRAEVTIDYLLAHPAG